ncbi:MAG TPA: ferritin-like protein [Pseudolysinimonas sp.]|nr:ferritin-like protein [Pseudolysinimonas sp.]
MSWTIESLQEHLQAALAVEHATIPPYFAAWISIKDTTNVVAAEIIRSVMLEEMLHLTLAANLLNAVRGEPSLTRHGFVPRYPHRLPFSGDRFEISIERFSKRALETFLAIERPEGPRARPEARKLHTIAQFYAAVRDGIDDLCDRLGEKAVFSGDVARQIQPGAYYAAGELIVVTNRDTAHQAITEIAEQGEGAHDSVFDADQSICGEGREPAHFYRFLQLVKGRLYRTGDTPKSGPSGARIDVDFDAVYPMRPNARAKDYPAGSQVRGALEAFGHGYGQLLASLEAAFNGQPARMTEGMARMFALRDQARALMQTPAGDGKTTVGLDFTAP